MSGHTVTQAIGPREARAVLNESDFYCEWAPPSAWRRAVVCRWEQSTGGGRAQRVVPDGHADLLLYDDGRTDVVGLHDVVALPELSTGTHVHGVRLRPSVVAAAFGVPAAELRNRTVAASDVVGSRRARRLHDPSALDAWLRSVAPHARADAAVGLLADRSVSDTADAIGVSARHLDRLLLDQIGLPPKVYQRVLRSQRFVHAVDAGVALAAAAADAGYTDQPHATREVRALAGITAARLATERRT